MDASQGARPLPYTDLALEATAALRGDQGGEIPGVRMEESRQGEVTVSRVEVFSEEGARAIGKAPGHYITLDAPGRRGRRRARQAAGGPVGAAAGGRVRDGLSADAPVLVVGLGNWNATPDALGPRVVNNLLVTRHLKEFVPPELQGSLRPVSAVSPGVLGLTGIETSEIIRGIVDRSQPSLVICIDALAARAVHRIGTSVQLSDTGINPGSGVGNRRAALNREALGVPVLAIGVPTVVHAATIANDTIDALGQTLQGKGRLFLDLLAEFSYQERQALIAEVLSPLVGDLVVTPKEVDDLITDMARVIAGALNAMLHPGVGTRDLLRYLGA